MIEEGRDPPRQYYERPEIDDCNAFYWEAFHDLSTERQIGMGMGPIPRSAVMDYADECGMNGDVAHQFASVIRRVDLEYLHYANSSNKAADRGTDAAVDDVTAMKSLMGRVAARAGSANKPQPKKVKNGNTGRDT